MSTTSGNPQGWPDNWGWGGIWQGYYPATDADMEAYRRYVGEDAGLDEGSLVGRYHRHYVVGGQPSPMGGEGSTTYEMQHIPDGVMFAPAEPGRWWVYGDGEPRKNKSREPLHRVYPDPRDQSYSALYAGPEPMSVPALVVKTGGDLVWNEGEQKYQMLDRDGSMIDYQRISSD
jgi:hypothetical protein